MSPSPGKKLLCSLLVRQKILLYYQTVAEKLAYNVKELARLRYFTTGGRGACTAFDCREWQNQHKKVVPCCCFKVSKY